MPGYVKTKKCSCFGSTLILFRKGSLCKEKGFSLFPSEQTTQPWKINGLNCKYKRLFAFELLLKIGSLALTTRLQIDGTNISHRICLLCLGAQSFEHANVLSEKNNFSALGGPGVAIFGPNDLHPMY